MSDEIHFTPAAKQVFRYHNGKEVVSADPLFLRGQLRVVAIRFGKTIDNLIDGVNRVDVGTADDAQITEGWQDALTLKEVVAEVFGLTPEADMAHALGLINAFYTYLEKKNRPADSQPDSMPSTASISATPTTTSTS